MAAKTGIARTFQNIQLFQNTTVLENVAVGFHIHTNTNMLDAVLGNARQKNTEKKSTKKARRCWSVWSWGNTRTHWQKPALRHPAQGGNCPCAGNFPQNSAVGRTRSRYEPERNPRAAFVCKKLNAEGLTVVVIEHDLKFIMNVCDHIMVLNYGQKLCEGNAQEIQNNKQVQEAYFGKRAGLGGTEG